MPWEIERQGNRHCVVRADTGDVEKCHATEQAAKDHMAALYAAESGKAVTKRETDGDHPASHYLVIENPEHPTTWHLRVRDVDGNLDHRLMGAAWAALHGGYRGNRYEGPDKQEAIRKLRRLYEGEDMPLPTEKMGHAVKALGQHRVGEYGILWGEDTRTDLTGEYFTSDTAEIGSIFSAMKRIPVLYHHAMDDTVRSTVVGYVDVMQPDDTGLWVEAQLDANHRYAAAVRRLVAEGKLHWSSGTLPGARRVEEDGHIKRWPVVEFSLTPTPAEFRMLARPVEEVKAAYQAIGLRFPDDQDAGQGAEEARTAHVETGLGLLELLEFELELYTL